MPEKSPPTPPKVARKSPQAYQWSREQLDAIAWAVLRSHGAVYIAARIGTNRITTAKYMDDDAFLARCYQALPETVRPCYWTLLRATQHEPNEPYWKCDDKSNFPRRSAMFAIVDGLDGARFAKWKAAAGDQAQEWAEQKFGRDVYADDDPSQADLATAARLFRIGLMLQPVMWHGDHAWDGMGAAEMLQPYPLEMAYSGEWFDERLTASGWLRPKPSFLALVRKLVAHGRDRRRTKSI